MNVPYRISHDEISATFSDLLASQGFATEKLSLQSLSLSCVVLDFSGGKIYNKCFGVGILFWTNTKD